MNTDFRIRYFIYIVLIIVGYSLLYIVDDINILHHQTICIFRSITGYPCPGCGMGHAMLALFHGHVAGALWYNPLSIPLLTATVLSVGWMIRDIFRNKESFMPSMKKKVCLPVGIAIAVIILAVWIWNLIKIQIHPQ